MTRARDLAKLISGSSTLGGTGELVLKDVDTADGSSPKITFQTGDTDIAADDVLGTIDFQAPDEGTGTDALLVAAGIEAVSEGDFSASSNATRLSFKTGASETATEKMTIKSDGNVAIGTTSPSTRLHIVTPDNTTANKITQGFGSARANINDVVAGGFDSEFVTRDGNVNTGAFIRVLDVNTNSSFPTTVRGGVLSFGTVDGTDGASTDADEKMRITHGGDVQIGTTTARPDNYSGSGSGTEFSTLGLLRIARNGDMLILNRISTDGDMLNFSKDGSGFGQIGLSGGNNMYISGTQTDHCGFTFATNQILPTTQGTANDDTVDLGSSSNRYDDVFATNSNIQTSDENEKQDIASLTSTEITAATAISKLFKTFKWKDKVRTHTGVVAQQVQSVMSDVGLDASKYAFWCSDTWWETQTEVAAVEADEKNAIKAKDAYTRTDIYHTKDEAPEGATERTRMGIRYPELLSFIGAATEQRLTSIEARLTALEAE